MVLHLIVLELVRRLRLRLRGRRHAEDVPKHGARARHVEPVVYDCECAQPARVGVQQPREERVADRLERSALLQDGVGRHSSPREVEGIVRRLVPLEPARVVRARLVGRPPRRRDDKRLGHGRALVQPYRLLEPRGDVCWRAVNSLAACRHDDRVVPSWRHVWRPVRNNLVRRGRVVGRRERRSDQAPEEEELAETRTTEAGKDAQQVERL
mmetsp:Transcript_49311/g.151687  ORF Transcript_49311/g.151687 Transcript_49311/m.151687 type:complete len:211 (+) Transcript_49311:363-995(+)